MDKETKLKIKIADASASRYIENNRFTIQSLAQQLDIEPSVIFGHFPNRSAILDYFYESRLLLFAEDLKQIKGYSDFSLSEKMSNLFYLLIDQFQQHREFVLLTYKERILSPNCSSGFQKTFVRSLEEIFSADVQISSTASLCKGRFLYQSIFCHFHGLILFWMNDQSQNYVNSMALIDKWCSLIEEIYYSKIIDRGFDFTKFLFYQSPFSKMISKS